MERGSLGRTRVTVVDVIGAQRLRTLQVFAPQGVIIRIKFTGGDNITMTWSGVSHD